MPTGSQNCQSVSRSCQLYRFLGMISQKKKKNQMNNNNKQTNKIPSSKLVMGLNFPVFPSIVQMEPFPELSSDSHSQASPVAFAGSATLRWHGPTQPGQGAFSPGQFPFLPSRDGLCGWSPQPTSCSSVVCPQVHAFLC